MEYRIIAADSHVIEPPDLWLNYIDSRFRDRAPHVERKDGNDFFIVEGLDPASMMALANAGQDPKSVRTASRYDEILSGGWDPDARLLDMDLDGVDAEVVYPSLGMGMQKLEDLDFLQACNRAYNDWVTDFAAAHPDRLKAIALIVADEVEWAVMELRRVAAKGVAGAMIPATPMPGQGYFSDRYDPFWAAAEELELPVSLHIIAGRQREFDPDRVFASYATLPRFIAESITDMIFAGVFERFPELTIVSAEADVAWIANVLERLDHFYQRYRYSRNVHLAGDALPSEVFKEHVYATFIRDRAGLKLLPEIGVDRVMWSSDYPHGDSTWPNSQRSIAERFEDVPQEHARKVLCDNAAGLYGFS